MTGNYMKLKHDSCGQKFKLNKYTKFILLANFHIFFVVSKTKTLWQTMS